MCFLEIMHHYPPVPAFSYTVKFILYKFYMAQWTRMYSVFVQQHEQKYIGPTTHCSFGNILVKY